MAKLPHLILAQPLVSLPLRSAPGYTSELKSLDTQSMVHGPAVLALWPRRTPWDFPRSEPSHITFSFISSMKYLANSIQCTFAAGSASLPFSPAWGWDLEPPGPQPCPYSCASQEGVGKEHIKPLLLTFLLQQVCQSHSKSFREVKFQTTLKGKKLITFLCVWREENRTLEEMKGSGWERRRQKKWSWVEPIYPFRNCYPAEHPPWGKPFCRRIWGKDDRHLWG